MGRRGQLGEFTRFCSSSSTRLPAESARSLVQVHPYAPHTYLHSTTQNITHAKLLSVTEVRVLPATASDRAASTLADLDPLSADRRPTSSRRP